MEVFVGVVETAITGQNPSVDINAALPYAALVNFYQAFNARNITLMASNWLHSNKASMCNPLGGVKRGWAEIRDVYEKIFNGGAIVYVEFYDYTIHTSDSMFIAVGRERGKLTVNNETIPLAIRTSRTFIKVDRQWKQLHHHGSMDNAELLATYQDAVFDQ